MARDESDREDLLREASALAPRIEVAFSSVDDPVFLGFKRDGGLSIYFGADPVYQFDRKGRLRRGYVAERLYRTQGVTLACLRRQRTATETRLVRNDLTADELAIFLERMRGELERLHDRLADKRFVRCEQFPAEVDSLDQFTEALWEMLRKPPALAPAIKGKR